MENMKLNLFAVDFVDSRFDFNLIVLLYNAKFHSRKPYVDIYVDMTVTV
jgi:hypothetical protein